MFPTRFGASAPWRPRPAGPQQARTQDEIAEAAIRAGAAAAVLMHQQTHGFQADADFILRSYAAALGESYPPKKRRAAASYVDAAGRPLPADSVGAFVCRSYDKACGLED
jgi:hypothetical protein